ncbi:glycerol-3-phosphate 1-O-acyltransferase PlsY [Clostridium aestuarii]|uniref:Glycerol-3-phosphate acyltransferase n=1 Tax=Clostridium aestuarii TaxID=338193 RepID=A0ABT4CWD9_9CLOT|nr:glycerol-3-phosphate 1-O-acyltransferase PlsY [Clostridium aestuarii]MCY6483304.1 glycerol-3-phosphate 1-O-acyltransferase PlsY [Clostridium aestuarii]
MRIIIAAAIGYLLGNVQAAYILGKLVKKIDIREHGNSNAGASNVTTVMGWKYGIITALVDIMKAVVAVLIIEAIWTDSSFLPFIAGIFVILGHVFPIFLGFKGGKGTASIIGMVLAIDYRIAVILIISIIIITIITDYIAIGTIVIVSILPVAIYIANYPMQAVIVCIVIAVLSIYKHVPNVKRIIKKEEIGLKETIRRKKK